MDPRILIVGTSPYNTNTPARAFDSYFSGWDRVCLAQIFSTKTEPIKGHCQTLYQITDERLLRKRLNRNIKTGRIFTYNELENKELSYSSENSNSVFKLLYNIGKNQFSIRFLLRGILWKKKYWCTEELNKWLEDIKPECVFLSFSNDFFIPRIACYVAKKFEIPIISSIGDDYYFNKKKTISPFYHLYIEKYRSEIRKVFELPGSAIYIGDKIRDKYNLEFGLDGETVYLTSQIQRRHFKEIDTVRPNICYFGNIRLGRNKSLIDIADALKTISAEYYLDIYSNETDSRYINSLKGNCQIRYHGAVPYSEIIDMMNTCDIYVIVEGFEPLDIETVKYSLSTKVADSLASGVSILAYGPMEAGAIEYIQSINCATLVTRKEDLVKSIKMLMYDGKYQKRNYDKAKEIFATNHTLSRSTITFRGVVNKVIKRGKSA